jgi:nucleoid DNA-binding protein
VDLLVKKIINKIEDYPKGLDVKAFKTAVSNTRITCGLSHDLVDIIVKIFTRELADALSQNEILDIPHLGTFYYLNKTADKKRLSFSISQEFKGIKNKGGTDENNFIRAVEKSSNRNVKRDEDDISGGE